MRERTDAAEPDLDEAFYPADDVDVFPLLGFYLLVPSMPLFIKELGSNESQVGVVMGLFTIAAVAARPLVSGLLDRLGRGPFALWGLVLLGLTMYSYAWAGGIVLLMMLRAVHGVGWALSSTAIGTAVTDNIPDSRRGEGMGWFGLAGTAAMAIGPLIGVWLLGRSSFHALFLAAAALVAAALICASQAPMPFQARPGAGRIEWFDKSLLPIAGAIFFLAFVYGGIVTFLPLFAASVHVNAGLFFLVYAVSLTLVRPAKRPTVSEKLRSSFPASFLRSRRWLCSPLQAA